MEEARITQDECPVCLDLLKDLVTNPCGHSCCKSCFTGCWDQEDQMRVYRCPQCRETFSPRPALAKNTMLAEVVEKLKKIKLPADCYTGAGDVQCDVCTGGKHKAVKSCLKCLESYCQNHLEQHESLFKGKRHNLTDATGRLQEMICQTHDKVLEVFCRTDQKFLCVLCTMDGHKNHDTVSAATQRTEKQKLLKETQRSFQQRIQQRQKDLEQLREAVESYKTAVENCERILTEIIRSIERSCSEATQRIRDQTAVSRAEGRLEQLEQEINDLRRKDTELEQLSHTQDHIHFLKIFQSLSAPPESTDVNDNLFSSLSSYDVVRESVLQQRDKLEDFCKEEIKISDRELVEENEESEELSEVEEKHLVKPGEKPLSRSKTKNTFLKRRAKKYFTCTQCGKSFTNKHHLDVHMRVHTGEKPYTCDQCGKSFSQYPHLKVHMRMHTGEKPFTCHQCGKSFTQSGHLTGHMRVHTGEKPYTCDQCGKSFTQSAHLTGHMRIHTGEKPFTCDQSSKTFLVTSKLKTHLRVHMKESHTCGQCGKSFGFKSHLKQHMKIHAVEKPHHHSLKSQ